MQTRDQDQVRAGARAPAFLLAAYLSWATFTTTGFDDIAALAEAARLAVTCEMVLTFVAVAGGLAVLLEARDNADG